MATTARDPRGFSMHLHETQAQSYDDLLEQDTRPVPDYVRSFGVEELGPVEIPARWYVDRELYQAEIENIWRRKWQMACRVDHVATVGDTYVYDVAGLSFVIVRASESEIKAYWNSCLHRGVPLRQCAGRVDRLQCPFHGFTWNLHGENVLIPHPEQFPHIDREKFSLPQVQVAIWQGFVFINPDPDAEPLETYMGPELEAEFSLVPFTGRELVMDVAKVFPANWKAVQEAFLESFHVLTTHPQFALSMAGDRCTTFGASGNVSRGILTTGQTSEYVSYTPDEQRIYSSLQEFWDDEPIGDFALPEGMTARAALIERSRNAMRPVLGAIADEVADTEVGDLFYYTLFPNFNPFGIFGQPMVYRFLPYGDDPDKSVMQVWFLMPLPPGVEPKAPAKTVWLTEEQEFGAYEPLGSFGAFISQDSGNLGGVMKGLRNSQTGIVNFARNYEMKIRHFYAVYERAMSLSSADEVGTLKQRRTVTVRRAG